MSTTHSVDNSALGLREMPVALPFMVLVPRYSVCVGTTPLPRLSILLNGRILRDFRGDLDCFVGRLLTALGEPPSTAGSVSRLGDRVFSVVAVVVAVVSDGKEDLWIEGDWIGA